MARQQFYTRVPFKVSMFNRSDSYDTFACSEGLDREFIEKELAMVCENKLTLEEAALIRKNELQPAYCQYTAKDNILVQSCTSYFEKDYTGERSTYLVHNIIFEPQETESLFYIQNRGVINPEMFVKDLDRFNITDPSAKPQKKYPLLDYAPITAEPTSWLTETFDAATLQRFIYAAISTVCGNVKSLFFVLPNNEQSQTVIRFFNTFFQIIPYYMRPFMSFATRINDISKFQNVKLKCLPDVVSVPPAKGAFLNMKTKAYTGLKDEDIAANRLIVEFFYTLVLNDEIRREFLLFSDHAVKSVPALAALNLKALGNLIFLFKSSSGMFDENAVLPTDEKLIDFYTIYEKNSAALSHEYRMNAAKSLQRYPRTHTAIPPKLFTKICKIYPKEIPGVKHIILSVFLELIHTDIMRDKLFTFIKNNYDSEDEETKVVIIDNLCRVFYGGFLQSQILAFFQQIFPNESDDTQNAIIDKLLLAIRNKEVKVQIVSFIKDNFDSFSFDIKKKFYDSTFEHLPDGDELAGELIDIVNVHIVEESEEEQKEYSDKLLELIDSEQSHRKHPLLRLIATKTGYCSEVVMRSIFTESIGKKPANEALECFCSGTYLELCERLKALWKTVPGISQENSEKMISVIETELQTNPKKPDLKSALAAAKLIDSFEPETSSENEEEKPDDQEFNENDAEETADEEAPAKEKTTEDVFFEMFCERVLTPVISENAADVFRYADGDQLMEIAVEYADKHQSVHSSEKFSMLTKYAAIRKNAVTNHPTRFTVQCESLTDNPLMRKSISAYMKKDLLASGAVSNRSMKYVVEAFVNYFKDGNFGLSQIYDANRQPPEDVPPEETKKSKDKSATPPVDPDLKLVTTMLKIANLIAVSAKTEKMKEDLYSDASGVGTILMGYIQGKKKADLKPLYQAIDSLKPEKNEFSAFCKKQIEQTPASPSGGGISMPSWLTNLFKKKK